VVSGGVLYVSSGGKVLAYDLGCEETTCRPAWSGTIHGVVRSGPVVTEDAVYVGTSEGDVVAFKPTGSAASGPGATVAAVALLVVGLLVVGLLVGVFVVRRRRTEFVEFK
jgi:outer membrane protein assembly factor BamB